MKSTRPTSGTRRRFSRGIEWFLFSACLVSGAAQAFLTDNGIHAPPVGGTHDYNAFKPGAPGFPALGGTYTDPVFGGVVRRLTARTTEANDHMYAHHWANANGTYAFQLSGVDSVISTTTGAVLWSNIPTGSQSSDLAWDATDPDKYYYYSGATLMRRNLAAGTNTPMYTFGGTLQGNGGSLNTQSADGRYFTVRYGGTNKVWDSVTNTVYSGAVTPLDSNGWVSITPDGKYLVNVAGPTGTPQREHYSYPIDHNTQNIGSTPTQFWGLCGDHGVLVSASDGKNYYVTFACHAAKPGVWRVDITLNQAGRSEALQQADNLYLVPLDDNGNWDNNDGHLSAVSKGAFRDWVFFDSENFTDVYNSGVAGWTAYKQEIMAINVLTGEVRRLAHHRSRFSGPNDGAYWNQPRISCSWDGSVVLWNSNFNVSSPPGYADVYAIQSPLGPGGPPPGPVPAPLNLRFK